MHWLLFPVLLIGVAACSAAAPTGGDSSNPAGTTPLATNTPNAIATGPTPTIESTPTPTPRLPAPPSIFEVPSLDTTTASVPLEDIVFDTFGRGPRFIPLSRASEDQILDLRDAITPIYQPVYGPPDSLPWLGERSLVMGYVSGDEAYAYPINVLNFHELVNDVIDGVPVLISYCPLCFSGVVYQRDLEGQTLLFGNTSALYQSDLVMYDHQTGSYWFQVAGEAVAGPLTNSRLKLLPSTTMEWGTWRKLHPDTLLLTGTSQSPTRFAGAQYTRGFSANYQERVDDDSFIFPVDEAKLDSRLSSGTVVLTVEVGEEATAYPLDAIAGTAVNDEIGGRPVLVLALEGERAVGAFSRVVDGQTLTFDYRPAAEALVDRETSTLWDAAGRAVSGPLAGTALERLNTRRAFWFSIAIALPEVRVYTP